MSKRELINPNRTFLDKPKEKTVEDKLRLNMSINIGLFVYMTVLYVIVLFNLK